MALTVRLLACLLVVVVSDSCTRPPEQESGVRKIAATELHFDAASSTPVISSAQKFIVPVPAFGRRGEPLVYPHGSEKPGAPILDYEGKRIGDRGLVFFNAKDRSWQAVAGDGEGVVIINEVTADQASQLVRKIQSFNDDPMKLTPEQLKQVLAFAREELKLGDMYNSTRSFVRSKMTAVNTADVPRTDGKGIEAYGLMKREDRDVCQAMYVPGKFEFQGPAATPQLFEHGGVIVLQGGETRGVQPEIFARTYRLADGRPIGSVTTDLAVWKGNK